jgi:hypothetical protein
VTFTATPTNGGTTPAYQWKLNGTNVGTNATTYTNASLSNNDVVTVVLTANNVCQTTAIANGNSITTTVTNNVTPSVTIAASTTDICPGGGTSVTFTATPTNGGTPSYQWKKNGTNVGTNASTFTSTTLSGGDVITVVMTATNTCQTANTATSAGTTINALTLQTYYQDNDGDGYGQTSSSVQDCTQPTGYTTQGGDCNDAQIAVNPGATEVCNLIDDDCDGSIDEGTAVTPSVAIASSDADNSICQGTSVTFTATPTNGGTTPAYQWKLNGTNVGTNATTYTNASLSNNDVVTVVMTANNVCQTSATANGNSITTTVTNNVTPAVAIASSDADNSICSGASVTFTATPTNGGTTPAYQWKLNGTNVGTNATTYTSTTLANSDIVSVVLTANNVCQTSATANGNNITTIVLNNLTPSVVIASSDADNSICSGTSVTFTATPTNGGTTPAYQWQLNGSNVGTNSVTYTNSTLATGDLVKVTMTANNVCQTTATANASGITTTVTHTVTPAIAITSSDVDNSICAGTSVTFTAAPTNGGSAPAYQWKLNGTNVGTNATTYTNASLLNNDVVTVVMTANNVCQTSATANGNIITTAVLNNSNYYVDADGDTYGPTASLVTTCIMPAGYTTESGDCDDNNPDAYPYNLEICNSIDDDCDGSDDNGLPSFTFHADVDGDGYGSNTSVVTTCDFVAGYILTAGDCNDNNSSVSPNASELCSTAFDDDCDGLINEVCNVGNDDPTFSSLINPSSSLVNCNSVSGTLTGASPSQQVGVQALTGNNPDVWFYFTASSPGITIRCISSSNDVALELRTGAGLLVKSVNTLAGNGDEYLNVGGLSVGSQYYVRVLQQDINNVGGSFTLCARRLIANSNLNYTTAILYDSGCDMVYATNATGANACSIQLTPIAPAGGPVLTAQGSTIPLSSFVGTSGQRFQYNTTYSALITLTFTLPLGNGTTENISVSNLSTTQLNVVQHLDLDLGSVFSCPSKVVIGGTVRATTWLCDAYRYQWKFEKTINGVVQLVNGNPVVIELLGPVGTRDFIPTATMGFTSGSEWRVQIRPIFANGVVGSYGDDYQCMLFKGTAAAMPTAENAAELEKSMEVENSDMTFMAYPNPSYNGELNVSWTVGEEVESAQMVVMDQQGRLVYTMNLNAAGFASINTSEWEAGIYHIRMSQGGTTTVKRWMKI